MFCPGGGLWQVNNVNDLTDNGFVAWLSGKNVRSRALNAFLCGDLVLMGTCGHTAYKPRVIGAKDFIPYILLQWSSPDGRVLWAPSFALNRRTACDRLGKPMDGGRIGTGVFSRTSLVIMLEDRWLPTSSANQYHH